MTTIELDNLKDLLLKVEKPARYTGGEYGFPDLHESNFNFCMCFPDLYEVGMSNLGIKIVAQSFLERGYTADFCFAPHVDFGDGLKARGVPLFSLGLHAPLGEFDIVGFSIQYELSYTNILYMLDLANIPLLRKDRQGKGYPLIVVGGPCAVNPEPLADFVDIVFIGDGERVDADVADLYVKYGGATEEFWQEAQKLDGVYIPALTQVHYTPDGKIDRFEGITKVKRAIIQDLDNALYPHTFAVPNVESVHDRAVIEVMRGCYRGCRFCQAGFIYRPVRRRSVDTLTQTACDLVRNTGYEEVSMNSLSTGDYKHLRELIRSLKANLPQEVTLALPSLRVDSFDSDFAQDSRRVSLTFAPEAGSQRLRDVINKDVTEQEILNAVNSAFDMGYTAVKLYFMMGLPTETDEDLTAIADVCNKIRGAFYSKKRSKQLRIAVSVSTFIPKPFTPFQWERQDDEAEVERKQALLRKVTNIKGITLNWSDYFTSKLEVAFARGDRRLSQVLLTAYRKGCRFDGWMKYFNKTAWQEAFDECHISMDEYAREWGEEELLPWDIIDVGIPKKFYLAERHRAYAEQVTGSCQTSCKGCGLQAVCPTVLNSEFTGKRPEPEAPDRG